MNTDVLMKLFNALYSLFFIPKPAGDSPFGTLNKTDMLKALRTTIVATVGYFLVEAARNYSGLDFGNYNDIVQILLGSAVAESGRRLLAKGADAPAQ